MHSPYELLWAAPAVILAAIIIGWGAETAQIYISQGLALAILAWLQTLPEFAVEAVVAWEQRTDLMIANLTGSLRLLVGLGWPLIYFTNAFLGKHRTKQWPILKLSPHNGLEVLALILGTVYFFVIWLKKTLTVVDGVLLFSIYAYYLWRLSSMPKAEIEEEDDLPWISHRIIRMKPRGRWTAIVGLFLIGGVVLHFSAHPFLYALEALAVTAGISSFVFIQWCAPFVSEFPEKVTAFNWARTGKKAPLALLNMMSSNIVQWTVMAGMLPILYNISKGEIIAVHFDAHQLTEIILTVVQSLLAVMFMMDLEMNIKDASGLFVLWLAQFIRPEIREEIIWVYIAWIIFELMVLIRNKKATYALRSFGRSP